MTDEAKAVVWQWPYSAFGNNKPTGVLKATTKPKQAVTTQAVLLEATPSTEMNLRMPGQYFDVETGLFFNWNRYLDSEKGRYTQVDPAGMAGGLNPFAYVGGRPLMSVDTTGLVEKYVLQILPNFLVTPGGTVYPVPAGASGPRPVINPSGAQTGVAFSGGKGGANGQVSTVRIMNPTPAVGKAPAYSKGYIKYENNSCPRPQGVDPYSGKTLPRSEAHFPID